MLSTGARPVLLEITRAEILLAFLFSKSATVLLELTCLLQATQWFTLFWSVAGPSTLERRLVKWFWGRLSKRGKACCVRRERAERE